MMIAFVSIKEFLLEFRLLGKRLKKERVLVHTLSFLMLIEAAHCYFLKNLLRAANAKPSIPLPKRSIIDGSGTGVRVSTD